MGEISDNLPRLMNAQGMTPEALAVALQSRGVTITANTVHTWMRGQRVPQLHTAKELAEALGCTMDDLVQDVSP